MKLQYFTDGSYTIEVGSISARFDDLGNLTKAEQSGVVIAPGGAAWETLESAYGGRENFEDWNKPHCIHD